MKRIFITLLGLFIFGCNSTYTNPNQSSSTNSIMKPVMLPNPSNSYSSLSNGSQQICSSLSGSSIVSPDGTFLGNLTNSYDSKSVLNEYGNHGSKHSSTSIWNSNGGYGGEHSQNSPFNKYTNSPPMIIKNGNVVGYLSANKNKTGSINPYVLKTCEF